MGTTALLPLLAVAFVVSSAFGDFDVPATADYYNSSGAPRWNDSAVDYTTPEPLPEISPADNHTTRAPRPDKTVTGAPLPDSYNHYREALCGRKLYDDGVVRSQLSGGQAPWIVAVEYGVQHHIDYETGFAISDHHVVTSSDVFMGRNSTADSFKWLVTNQEVDMTKCKDRVMRVPTSFKNAIRVFNCGNLTRGESCPGSGVPNTVISAHFIGDCSGATSGLVVMEVKEPFDVKVVHPICVPDQPISRLSQDLVSYGVYKAYSGSGNKTLISEKLQTVRCRSGTSRNSICTRGSYCKAGFPLTNFNDNQEYVVAVSTKEGCNNGQSENISFAEFYPEIGHVTGIRNVKHPTTSRPEVVARSRSSTVDYGRPSNNGSHY